MQREIYLDANASSPLRPEARDAVLATLDLGPGNASSPHAAGRRLRKALGDARDAVAALVGARPSEIVFTSGATESNALAVLGALAASPGTLVTTFAEHPSIARVADRLAAQGVDVRRAGVDRWGRFDAGEVITLADGAALVAATLAQSTTGALEPVADVARGRRGVPIHVDAAQAVGRVDVDVGALGATFLSFSAHKIGGPQGIGALVIREGAAWRSPFGDVTQELGRRGGTEAVALAAGFGAAALVVKARGAQEAAGMAAALAPLVEFLDGFPGAEILTPRARALPNTLLAAFDGCPGDATMAALDANGFRASTGSACASGSRRPPEVLIAAGRDPKDAARAVRFSASFATSADEIRRLAAALPQIVARVRAARATS